MVTTRSLLVPLLDAGQGVPFGRGFGEEKGRKSHLPLEKVKAHAVTLRLLRLPAPPSSPLEEQLSVSESAILIPVGEIKAWRG